MNHFEVETPGSPVLSMTGEEIDRFFSDESQLPSFQEKPTATDDNAVDETPLKKKGRKKKAPK